MNDYLKDDFEDIVNSMSEAELEAYNEYLNSTINDEIKENRLYKNKVTKNK